MSTTVSVMLMTVKPPLIVEGTVIQELEDSLTVELPEGTPIPKAGSQVVLDFPQNPHHAREVVTILSAEGNRIRAKIRLKHLDLRDAPRLYAGIEFHYQVVTAGGPSPEAWMAGSGPVGEMFHPDPYMNFSMTGLQFEDLPRCSANDTLLFTLQLQRDRRVWRGTARVVRVFPIPEEERESDSPGSHRIAVTFLDVPDECRKALVDQTRRIHDSLV